MINLHNSNSNNFQSFIVRARDQTQGLCRWSEASSDDPQPVSSAWKKQGVTMHKWQFVTRFKTPHHRIHCYQQQDCLSGAGPRSHGLWPLQCHPGEVDPVLPRSLLQSPCLAWAPLCRRLWMEACWSTQLQKRLQHGSHKEISLGSRSSDNFSLWNVRSVHFHVSGWLALFTISWCVKWFLVLFGFFPSPSLFA